MKAKGIFFLVNIRESEVKRMTNKFSRALAVSSVVLLSAVVVAPLNAADPVVTTGTIRVVSVVINNNMGTKTPADFIFSVKHWGADAVGSPIPGQGAPGVAFVVEAGTYVVHTPIIDGYNGLWSGTGISNGFIDLQPGQDITIIRTSDDVGMETSVTPALEPATEDGGTLPGTASPWFNALAVGLLISAAGIMGFRKLGLSNK